MTVFNQICKQFIDHFRSGIRSLRIVLPGMAQQTLTVFSFSKSYGLAGMRVGYLVGRPRVMLGTRKMTNHTIYNVPRPMQASAMAAE